ncbi:Cytochrome c [Mucilaginibacter mallensis]|uniref:Cytochrome c n=1 Tax=Mucilaginibacter mallensis TaxID=652787 RepID=A0A1H1SXZ2_MUCMA|nr:c-type cytochrome [Mucilaginibacter mallensis]SDS52279.1 Cytochrome c [Mucilaginibacter mallensis]
MKKIGKGLLYLVIAVVLIAVIAVSYITLALPSVGKPENITIAITPQRVLRGKYLANHVSLCMDCHSQRDWSKSIGAIEPDKFGAGGDKFDSSDDGLPGVIYVPNITPHNLKNWTDGELFRAITTGERKDGSAIFPLMPWDYYSKMSREDLYSIIAYLRKLTPIVTSPYPKRQLDFPLNILVYTMPHKASLGEIPPQSDTIKYGAYIINEAACGGCHSPLKNGKIIHGMDYAGGRDFKIQGRSYYSANITPDKATGIGNWTREAFVNRFKSYTDSAGAKQKNAHAISPMPWYDYSGMSEADLKAIYAYLKSIKPVSHKIVN